MGFMGAVTTIFHSDDRFFYDRVGRDNPARRLAVIERMQLPASGTPSGRALQKMRVIAEKKAVGAAISRP